MTISTINPNAHEKVFNSWMRDNYEFSGAITHLIDRVDISNLVEFTTEEKDEIESYYHSITEAMCLDAYRDERIEEFQERTDHLIDLGFNYAGHQFALTRRAEGEYSQDPQTNLLSMYVSRDVLQYPISFNTIDRLSVYVCTDAGIIESMYLTALSTKKGRIDSGEELNELVRLETTKAGIYAVTDNR